MEVDLDSINFAAQINGASLIVKLTSPNLSLKSYKFAFYLYRDRLCIEKIMYQSQSTLEFPLLEAGDYFVVGFIRPPGSKAYQKIRSNVLSYTPPPRIRRSVRLKEWGASTDRWLKPKVEYLEKTTNLPAKYYRLRTDENGFIASGNQSRQTQENDWIFLGASFVESVFNDEDKRFCAIVEKILKGQGINIRCRNGGYSGATSLHLLNVVMNKVIPLSPKKMIFFVPTNDSTALRYKSSYWTNHKQLSPILPYEHHFTSEHLCPSDPLFITLDILNFAVAKIKCELIICTTPHRHKDYEADTWLRGRFPDRLVFERIANERKHVNQMARQWSSENSVKLLDLEHELDNFSEYSYDDRHLTNEGSVVVAEMIADFMMAECADLKVRRGTHTNINKNRPQLVDSGA